MPDELRDRLSERSKTNGRSLNAEILGILQEAVTGTRAVPSEIDVDALAEAIAAKVAAKLGERSA